MKAIHVLNHTDMNALRLASLCALLMGKGSRLEIPQRPSQCRLLMKLVQKFSTEFYTYLFLDHYSPHRNHSHMQCAGMS